MEVDEIDRAVHLGLGMDGKDDDDEEGDEAGDDRGDMEEPDKIEVDGEVAAEEAECFGFA